MENGEWRKERGGLTHRDKVKRDSWRHLKALNSQ